MAAEGPKLIYEKLYYSTRKSFIKKFQWRCTMQFWNTWRVFAQFLDMGHEKSNSFRSLCSKKCSCAHAECRFNNTAEIFFNRISGIFCSMTENDLRNQIVFQRNLFSSKCSYGHEEWNFDRPARKSLTYSWKFSRIIGNCVEKFNFFHQKVVFCRKVPVFWQPQK